MIVKRYLYLVTLNGLLTNIIPAITGVTMLPIVFPNANINMYVFETFVISQAQETPVG